MIKSRSSNLFILFLIVFLDLVGVGIVVPVLAPLLLNPSPLSDALQWSVQSRTILLGFLIAIYPLAQFFGAPLLGALADHHGRKPVLLISLVGTMVGYFFFALGILWGNLPLIFFSRILDGFTGGNISVANSSIADMSDGKSKTRNFGLIGMAFGFGFIVGPFLGGVLSDPQIVSWFNFDTPFWCAFGLSFLNILLIVTRFKETLPHPIQTPLSIWTGFRNLKRAYQMVNLRVMFAVVLFTNLGFTFFTQFFPVYLIEKFAFTQSQIGFTFAFIGASVALAQGVVVRPVSRRVPSHRVLSFSILFLAVLFPLLLFPPRALFIYFIIPFIALFQGLTHPNATTLVSNLADAESQGEVMGVYQSVQAVGHIFPPLIAGFIAVINVNLPLLTAGLMTFFAWFIFMRFFRPQFKARFHEI